LQVEDQEGGHIKRGQQSEKRTSAPARVDGRTASLYLCHKFITSKAHAKGETRETGGGHYSKPISKLESNKGSNGKMRGANL